MPSVASRLKKNMIRTKQKILQGMGLDMNRTNDHNFDIYAQQFEQQHKQASKLTHDLNKYLNCLKETQRCSKAFYDTLKETYEPNWPDSHLFYEQIQLIEYKWLDYLARLNNDVQLPLIAYSNEFPELKKKIEKRTNRLIDYDNARQALLNIQNKTAKHISGGTNSHNTNNSHNSLNNNGRNTNNNTSKSEQIHSTENLTKITKLKIDLEDKQHIYEEINQTLCMSLPVLYENRIKFYSSLFQTFFHAETLFYSDCAEIKTKLDSICEMLSNKTISSTQVAIAAAAAAEAAGASSNSSSNNSTSNRRDNGNDSQNDESQDENSSDSNINSNKMNELPFLKISPPKNASTYINNNSHNHNVSLKDDQENTDLNSTSATNYYTTRTSNTVLNNSSTNTTTTNNNNSSSYLYKVKAAYAYSAKELDELTFGKDDSIQVVEGTESEKEDLDDGWLIGIHESTSKRGIFPENFTRRI